MKQFVALGLLALCFATQSFLSFPRQAVMPILDAQAYIEMPRGLRSTQAIKHLPACVNLKGLNELKISGSGQFSEQSFAAMVKELAVPPKQLLVVDLRQESHGLINGEAVSWKGGEENYANVGKTKSEIETDEQKRLMMAREAGQIIVSLTQEDKKFAVENVKTERELVEAIGGSYLRIPVTDHNRPDDATIDQFVEFVRTLSPDQWVHFHCKAGRGRTTTFMALLDIIKNSDKATLEEILDRQEFIGGTILKKPSAKTVERFRSTSERVEFLKNFYAYSRAVPDFHLSWSQWVAQQSAMAAQ